MKSKLVSLSERDIIVRGALEDPTVAACLLSNCLTTETAEDTDMTKNFILSVPEVTSIQKKTFSKKVKSFENYLFFIFIFYFYFLFFIFYLLFFIFYFSLTFKRPHF